MSRHADRCSLVTKNGEKRQISSFGQISRRPPPAKPQPTAKGSAPNSPANERRQSDRRADERAGVRAGDQAGEKRAGEREVRGVVVEQQPRADAGDERNAEADGKLQPLRPVAFFREEDSPEPVEAHEHRRENRGDGDVRHQRNEGSSSVTESASCGIESTDKYNIDNRFEGSTVRGFDGFQVRAVRSSNGNA